MIMVADVIQAAAIYFDLSTKAFTGPLRVAEIAQPRMIAMMVARDITGASTTLIGRAFGGRDHSTIIHGANRARDLVKKYPSYAAAPSEIASMAEKIAAGRQTQAHDVQPVNQGRPPGAKPTMWTPDTDAELLRLWRSSQPWVEISNRLGVCVCVCRYRLRKLRAAGAGIVPDDVPAFVPLMRHRYL
jgi:hypothetical protein